MTQFIQAPERVFVPTFIRTIEDIEKCSEPRHKELHAQPVRSHTERKRFNNLVDVLVEVTDHMDKKEIVSSFAPLRLFAN